MLGEAMNSRAVYVLIGLWVLLPTVFYVIMQIEERRDMKKSKAKRIKFSCACGNPRYMPEPYMHGQDHCQPLREMVQ